MKRLSILIMLTFCLCRLYGQGTEILLEDFENTKRDWKETDEFDNTRVIQNGKLRMTTETSKFYWTGQYVMPDKKTDFSVEAELSFVKFKSGTAGLVWGDEKAGQKLWFFLLSPNGAWNFGTWSPKFFTLTGSQKSAVINKDLATNKLKIERIGSKLKLYVNDVEVHSTKFPSTKGNLVGVVSGGGDHTVDVNYFNVMELAKQ
jgi:hypothetical protein